MKESEKTTLEKILEEAKREFLEKGYQKASLREIVKKAGVTTGAFYGYFKNKEKLFDALVGQQYEYMTNTYDETLKKFFQQTPEDQYDSMTDITYECMVKMKNYMYDNFDQCKLILCCSEGTKYHDFVHEMAERDIVATHNFAQTINKVGGPSMTPVNPVLEHILTSGMFAAFFELIVHDVPREEADLYIKQLLDFHSAGWGKIMGF